MIIGETGQLVAMIWMVYLIVQGLTVYGIYAIIRYHAYPRMASPPVLVCHMLLGMVLFVAFLFEVGIVLRCLIVLTLDLWGIPWFRQ